jgi:hypothetical protein
MSKARRFYPSAKMARAVADREAGQGGDDDDDEYANAAIGGAKGFYKMLDITTMARRMAKAVQGLVSLGWFKPGTVTAVENQMDRDVLHAQEGMWTALITYHAMSQGPKTAGSVVLAASKYGVPDCLEFAKSKHPRMKDPYKLRKKSAEVAGDIFIQAVTSQTDVNCPNRRFRDWLLRQVSEGRLARAYDFWDAILLVMQYFLDNIRTKAYSDRDRIAVSGVSDVSKQHAWVRDGIGSTVDIVGIDPGFKHCALVAATLDMSALGPEGIPKFNAYWKPGELARGPKRFFAITGACMIDLCTPKNPKAMVVYLSDPPPSANVTAKPAQVGPNDDSIQTTTTTSKKRPLQSSSGPTAKRVKMEEIIAT